MTIGTSLQSSSLYLTEPFKSCLSLVTWLYKGCPRTLIDKDGLFVERFKYDCGLMSARWRVRRYKSSGWTEGVLYRLQYRPHGL